MFGIKNINLKLGFTFAEAIIVMTILGIIAIIMITNLKPSEFRDKAFQVQAKKLLREIDEATYQIMINNTQNGKLDTLYKPNSTDYVVFNDNENIVHIATLYKKYMTATRKPCAGTDCTCGLTQEYSYRFKDGSCIAFQRNGAANNTIYGVFTIFPGGSDEEIRLYAGDSFLYGIAIDINSEEEPNILGKDMFMFPLNKDGIMYDD